jgi:methionine aminotransferase
MRRADLAMTHFLPSRLPRVGTTIFTVMSRLAAECMARSTFRRAFPTSRPRRLPAGARDAPHGGGRQPVSADGRRAFAARGHRGKSARLYLAGYDPESEVTVTAGATQAIYTAIAACVRPGDEVIVFAPVYDSYVPGIELNGGRAVLPTCASPSSSPTGTRCAP